MSFPQNQNVDKKWTKCERCGYSFPQKNCSIRLLIINWFNQFILHYNYIFITKWKCGKTNNMRVVFVAESKKHTL